MLDPTSREDLKFKDLLKVNPGLELHKLSIYTWEETEQWEEEAVWQLWVLLSVQALIDWINSELEEDRIIVKDLEEDCYDGQVLQKLLGEKLASRALTSPTHSFSTFSQNPLSR